MHPVAVSLILRDGNPLGIRTAEIGSSVIQATVIPRSLWKSSKEMDILQNPGVYFLISNIKDDASYDLYVGEAENIFNRVSHHVGNAEKDFWNYAVCFTAKDGSLHKAHAKLLESCLCKLATSVGRANMMNGNAPKPPKLSEHDSITAMQFHEHIKLLLATLGFPVLIPLTSKQEYKTYYCKGPSADAKGMLTEEGFVVLKDSIARKEWTEAVRTERVQREVLLEEGVLVENGDESYRFTQDYKFSSPSRAAVVVLSRPANGWTEWKDDSGKTLDENERG